MRSWLLLSSLIVTRVAFAQSESEAPPVEAAPVVEPAPPVAEPVPPAPPAPTAPPAPVAPVVAQAPVAPPSPTRPDGVSFGIGIGFVTPTDASRPNAASVRVRIPGGLTFEPTVTLTNAESRLAGRPDVEDTSEYDVREAGIIVRVPVRTRGKVDLEILGSLAGTWTSHKGSSTINEMTTAGTAIAWGIAATYWLSAHWAISVNATNPLFDRTRTETVDMGVEVGSRTTTTYGLVFDPTVSIMIHLFN